MTNNVLLGRLLVYFHAFESHGCVLEALYICMSSPPNLVLQALQNRAL